VIVAEVEGGGESVARVFESPGRSKIKIIARSEAKHRKRSFFIASIMRVITNLTPLSPLFSKLLIEYYCAKLLQIMNFRIIKILGILGLIIALAIVTSILPSQP